jgi:hypothetical protein
MTNYEVVQKINKLLNDINSTFIMPLSKKQKLTITNALIDAFSLGHKDSIEMFKGKNCEE